MSPTVKQRLRPQRSVSLPPGIINAAMTSRKMVIATWMPWTVVSRSWLMSLIITFMLVPAKLQMNWARASGTSTCRNAADGRPPVPASATSHLPPHESGRHSTAGYAEALGGRPRSCLRTAGFPPVDHGPIARNGASPDGGDFARKVERPPLGSIGRLRGLTSPTAPQLPSRRGAACLVIRFGVGGALIIQTILLGSFKSRLERQRIQREQAGSVWSRLGVRAGEVVE